VYSRTRIPQYIVCASIEVLAQYEKVVHEVETAICDGGIDWLYHNMLVTVTLEKRQEKVSVASESVIIHL
jgi:hypothetical protein